MSLIKNDTYHKRKRPLITKQKTRLKETFKDGLRLTFSKSFLLTVLHFFVKHSNDKFINVICANLSTLNKIYISTCVSPYFLAYTLWTSESPVFDYSGISNYYKLWVCCSDQWGVTANFLEIDIVNVIVTVEYIPPSK